MFGINGKKPGPAPAPNVPIVGQPFDIKGWHATVLFVCKCDAQGHPLLVMNDGWTKCRACGKAYTLQGLLVAPGQPPRVNFGIRMTEDEKKVESVAP